VLIAPARPTATPRSTAQLLLSDEGKRGTELFVLDNRRLGDLTQLVEGAVGEFDTAITDRQPAVGIIDDGDPLADRRLGLVGRFQDEQDLMEWTPPDFRRR
jgi:hypothetical protein